MLRAIVAASLLTASGCCGNLLLSHRHGEPTCGAVVDEAEFESDLNLQRGVPVLAWPNFSLPRCWHARTSEFATDFNEFLEPTPPPPAKPPHSRFHPLPTQPVFSPRVEYTSPELLGVDQQHPLEATPLGVLSPGEEIPIPVPETGRDPTWRDLPAPVVPDAPSPEDVPEQAVPMLQQPPALMPPAGDPSRGNVAPATFLRVAEPNPLRSAK